LPQSAQQAGIKARACRACGAEPRGALAAATAERLWRFEASLASLAVCDAARVAPAARQLWTRKRGRAAAGAEAEARRAISHYSY
jgi:hypothetical protein